MMRLGVEAEVTIAQKENKPYFLLKRPEIRNL